MFQINLVLLHTLQPLLLLKKQRNKLSLTRLGSRCNVFYRVEQPRLRQRLLQVEVINTVPGKQVPMAPLLSMTEVFALPQENHYVLPGRLKSDTLRASNCRHCDTGQDSILHSVIYMFGEKMVNNYFGSPPPSLN